ncbi:hypothetical protein [uncultured Brevibacillus sp.]|uniref:hypothetical protein n=1 Tax=uncultured Brevibacillus sp. TaxID=169970 RepID=UPI002594F890|nr:hypothetical protein [uncultured Brevibacillus sp.]
MQSTKSQYERIIVTRFHMLSADQQITTVAPGLTKSCLSSGLLSSPTCSSSPYLKGT